MPRARPSGELSSAARLRGFVPEAPSPARLRRATSPERERLWQGRKAYRLSAGFFLPLTGEDETCPLCQGLHLRGRWHFAKRNDGRGSSRKRPSPSRLRRATSPERERLWQGRKVCSLTAGFFLPLTNEDETCRFCQGLPLLGELSSAARLRGFFPEATLSRPATKRGTAGRRGFISPNTKNARSFHCGRLDFPQGSGQTGENSPVRMRLTKRSRLHPSRRSFLADPGGSQ